MPEPISGVNRASLRLTWKEFRADLRNAEMFAESSKILSTADARCRIQAAAAQTENVVG